jgi:phosphoglycolate phosphatase
MANFTNPYLLFDFDGTLADSLSLGLRIVNDLSERIGYKPISQDEMEVLRGQPITAVFKRLHLPIYKLPMFIHHVKTELTKRLSELQPFDELPEVLNKFKQAGISMALLSSNSINNILPFLKKFDMEVFEWYDCDVGLFNKSRALHKQTQRPEIKFMQPVYIGDELRDIRAAKSNRIPIVSVTWGFQPKYLLEKNHPDYLVDTPKELTDLFL